MRPPARPSSAFYAPLDHLLSSPTLVRLLRVLTRHPQARTALELARAARLGRTGVYQALTALIQLGVVDSEEEGKGTTFRFNRQHLLAPPILRLFEAESNRPSACIERLRQFARERVPFLQAIWLVGRVARREDEPGSELELVILVESLELPPALAELRAGLRQVEQDCHLHVAPRLMTQAQLLALPQTDRATFIELTRDAQPIAALPSRKPSSPTPCRRTALP